MWRRTGHGKPDARAAGAARSRAIVRAVLLVALLALPAAAWLARMAGFPVLADAVSLALVGIAMAALARGLGARAAAGFVLLVALLVLGAWLAALPPVYWPPVAINLALAGAFGVSLREGEPLILRFARMEGAQPTPALLRYCRRLTIAWTAYLVLLGLGGIAIALHGDELIGAWWCGIVNYLLIALLFVGERMYRSARGDAPAGLLEQARNVRSALRSPRT